MSLVGKYNNSFAKRGHLCCVGIDPRLEDLVNLDLFGNGIDSSLAQYCDLIIESSQSEIDIFKFNLAFFLAMGPNGISLLAEQTRKLKVSGKIVVLDAKFGDIKSTVEAYAEAFLTENHYSFDAITVSPLSGQKGMEVCSEYIKDKSKGVFVWFSSSDIDDSMTEEEQSVWISNIGLMNKLKKSTNLFENELFGAVSPINTIENSSLVRETLESNYLLAPGFGAQGGNFNAFKKLIYKQDDPRIVVSSSRGIIAGALSTKNISEASSQIKDNCTQFSVFYKTALR